MQVEGIVLPDSKLTKHQVKTFGPRSITGYESYRNGDRAVITVKARYDDECGNGHNTFAITADVTAPGNRDILAGGCMHEDIVRAFPELAHLIKWHLVSSDGPMHYLANTVYLAGNRDYNGRAAGEPSSYSKRVRFGTFPIEWSTSSGAFMKWLETAEGHDFEVIRIDYPKDRETLTKLGPKYTLGGAPDKWHECPFDTEREGLQFLEAMKLGWEIVRIPTAYSEGKARELDSARHAAVWPDATDEDLTAPGLRERLLARLPKLMDEFKTAMTSDPLNFVY